MYVELHTSSAFSFLRAASLPEPLVERAALLGYPAVALLDRDGLYGAPRFHKAAKAAGLRPIIGAELTLEHVHHDVAGRPRGRVASRAVAGEQRPLPAASRYVLPVLIASAEGNCYVPAYPAAQVVDTTGAGDAFCGGFLTGQLCGLDEGVSAKIGHGAAVCVIGQLGGHAGAPTLPQLLALLGANGDAALAAVLRSLPFAV